MECKTSELLELEEELREENNVCNHFYSNGVNVDTREYLTHFNTEQKKVIYDVINDCYDNLERLSK